MARTLSDWLSESGYQPPEGTLFSVKSALEQPIEIGPVLDPLEGFFARMPGDSLEDHLKSAEVIQKPIPEMSVVDMSRGLREGVFSKDLDLERKVRAYIEQWQRFNGAVLYDPSCHINICPVEQQFADRDTISPHQSGSLRSADSFDLGNFQWGQHR